MIKLNLNIRNIDPEARGLLYRCQAEREFRNLADTIKFVMKKYYKDASEAAADLDGENNVS
ncbi:hypothetical protein KAR91_44715 [Candidatus Pacearchaeota archaeon]|nr:hypothetical protein [Candidatus Pacearchaeota archaeon]